MIFHGDYDVKWYGPGKNSSDSMPVGGHDIGCNVWTQEKSIYLYIQQSGWFDENNSMLKFGRLHLEFDENLIDEDVTQELILEEGYIVIHIKDICITIWVDVQYPVVHMEYKSAKTHHFNLYYESWRSQDKVVDSNSFELFQCKEVFKYPDGDVIFHKDTILPEENFLLQYHANIKEDLSIYKEFDAQGIGHYKEEAYNPQVNLICGGKLELPGMKYIGQKTGKYQDTEYTAYGYEPNISSCNFHIQVILHWEQTENEEKWEHNLASICRSANADINQHREYTREWWRNYFGKSYIQMQPSHQNETYDKMWTIGRNYQLFRYMLGCNYYGYWPTKFNGGLFTFDPGIIKNTEWWDGELSFTPDYRLWGGGSHTIQNQRLLYWPMLKSGDGEVMVQEFNLFNRALDTAKMRAKFYYNIDGAFYAEQMGNYGLCNTCDHGWDNHTGVPVPQIKYLFSNNLEIALLILEYWEFTGKDISEYMEFIDNVVMFYDGFYPENDENGKMIMYPANALETYHVVKNPIDGIAGLRCLLPKMLKLPENLASYARKEKWRKLMERVPSIKTKIFNDEEIIAYADTESDIQNCELPEMYTVFPYDIYGIGKAGIDLARRTIRNSFHTEEMRTHISWHYTGIEYARLGMLSEALEFLGRKMSDGPHRFPTFWGPGHDWTPDHNWGGTGEIQLQEMLMQTREDVIYLFPCWPSWCDVRFKLYAPQNTIISCGLKEGKIEYMEVVPEERKKDIIIIGPAKTDAENELKLLNI